MALPAVRATAFGLAITLTAFVADPPVSTRRAPFQPPDWVFGVVWPLLYLTTGAAWTFSRADLLFGALTLLCCAWLLLYPRAVAALDLLATCALAAVGVVHLTPTHPVAAALLAPLAAWTAFAAYLNLYALL